jgi:hypothetical protein
MVTNKQCKPYRKIGFICHLEGRVIYLILPFVLNSKDFYQPRYYRFSVGQR